METSVLADDSRVEKRSSGHPHHQHQLHNPAYLFQRDCVRGQLCSRQPMGAPLQTSKGWID